MVSICDQRTRINIKLYLKFDMTLGRKVGLYTKYGKKKWRFYEIDGFKMGDFQIWQSDIFSILWNFSLEKAVVFC